MAARNQGDYKRAAALFRETVSLLDDDESLEQEMKAILGVAMSVGLAECHALSEHWWELIRTAKTSFVAKNVPPVAMGMALKLRGLGC